MTGCINTCLCCWMMLEELRRSQKVPLFPCRKFQLGKALNSGKIWVSYCFGITFIMPDLLNSFNVWQLRTESAVPGSSSFPSQVALWTDWSDFHVTAAAEKHRNVLSKAWLLMMESLYAGQKCLPFWPLDQNCKSVAGSPWFLPRTAMGCELWEGAISRRVAIFAAAFGQRSVRVPFRRSSAGDGDMTMPNGRVKDDCKFS